MLLLATAVLARAAPCCHVCPTGTTHYWANDKPNHECAESCLDTSHKLTMAEFWVLTGGQGKRAATSSPCAAAGFPTFDRTDVIGAGPVRALTEANHPSAVLRKGCGHPFYDAAHPAYATALQPQFKISLDKYKPTNASSLTNTSAAPMPCNQRHGSIFPRSVCGKDVRREWTPRRRARSPPSFLPTYRVTPSAMSQASAASRVVCSAHVVSAFVSNSNVMSPQPQDPVSRGLSVSLAQSATFAIRSARVQRLQHAFV